VYYLKYNRTLQLNRAYVPDKSHAQATSMCEIKTSWEKWG